jgi:putative peptide zinc metalloprotease protein
VISTGNADGDQDLELPEEPSVPAEFDTPRRAPGVDLVGAVDASGYTDQQWLVCIDGTRYMRATRVLYGVLQHADGRTNFAEIARRVSAEVGRQVSADQVFWLIRERLAPAGLIVTEAEVDADADPDGDIEPPATEASAAPAPRRRRRQQGPPAGQLLAIQRRLPILPYRFTAPITARLQHLYALPVMVAVGVAGVAVNVWLYTTSSLSSSIHTLIFAPGLILFLLLLDVPIHIFHELGHASAMRRADVPHGEIGVALYVIVPVYYTDVTHAYRLERSERVRIDLGGMYFDLISIIGLGIAYSATRLSILLIAMMVVGFNMLREFTPFMRFDGYYLMADLLGVHEPLSMLSALVSENLPGRRHDRGPRLLGVTPRVKVALAAYLVVILAFLLRPLVFLSVVGGSAAFVTQLGDSARALWSQLTTAAQTHDLVGVVTAGLQLFFWALIPLGLAFFFVALVRVLFRGGRAVGTAVLHRVKVRAERRRAVTAEVGSAAQPDVVMEPEPPPLPPRSSVVAASAATMESDGLPLIVEVDGSVPDPSELPPPPQLEPAAQLELSGVVCGEPRRIVSAAVEGTLERAAAHHAVELRDLVDQVRVIYEQELAACRREIELLRERALRSERDREKLQASLSELENAFARHVSTLTALGDDVIRRAEVARRERDVTLSLVHDA